MMRVCEQPRRARRSRTKGAATTPRATDRTVRAAVGVSRMVSARMTLLTDWPSAAMRESARMMGGQRHQAVHHPLAARVARAAEVGGDGAPQRAQGDAEHHRDRARRSSESRAPQITRLSTSRPSWSVPIGKLRGRAPRRGRSRSPWGRAGASTGASTASRISTTTITAPAAPSGWRMTKRPSARAITRTGCAGRATRRGGPPPGSTRRKTSAITKIMACTVGIVALADRLHERGAHAGHHEDDLHDHERRPAAARPTSRRR